MVNIASSALLSYITGYFAYNKVNDRYVFIGLSLWLLIYLMVNSEGTMSILLFILSFIVVGAFLTRDLLIFYIIFELSIVPIMIVIMMFGYQPEKIQASLYLLVYTVTRRIPLLLFIVYSHFAIISSTLLTLSVLLCFFVKTPRYILHIWLPKAHVEAPLSGSIVLAGVLLKIGSYGLIIFLPIMKLNNITIFFFAIAFLGSIVCSLLCLRQSDMKRLIAYSSIVHMGVVTIGLIRGTEIGRICRLMMIVGHGISSPFIFFMADIIYKSTHSRLLLNNKNSNPFFCFGLILITSLNIGVPPRINLWSEVLLAACSLYIFSICILLLLTIFFFRTLYNLYFFVSITHNDRGGHCNPYYILPIIQVSIISYSSLLFYTVF